MAEPVFVEQLSDFDLGDLLELQERLLDPKCTDREIDGRWWCLWRKVGFSRPKAPHHPEYEREFYYFGGKRGGEVSGKVPRDECPTDTGRGQVAMTEALDWLFDDVEITTVRRRDKSCLVTIDIPELNGAFTEEGPSVGKAMLSLALKAMVRMHPEYDPASNPSNSPRP